MANDVSNSDDIINFSDVIDRIEELEDEREEAADHPWQEIQNFLAKHPDNEDKILDDGMDGCDDKDETRVRAALDFLEKSGIDVTEAREILESANDGLEEWEADYQDEYDSLKKLQEEVENVTSESDATLIRETYFEEYAQELCEDIGDIPKNFPNYIVIDWEATAENLKQDYSSVDFDGETYLVRA